MFSRLKNWWFNRFLAKPWGYHLMLDCRECDMKLITDPLYIKDFSRALVKKIDMIAYGEPQVVHFAAHDIDKAGYTLVQLIETSNITAHFCDKQGDAYIDIFSCKPFDTKEAQKLVQTWFGPTKISRKFQFRQA